MSTSTITTGSRVVVVATEGGTSLAPVASIGTVEHIGTVVRVRMDEPRPGYWGGNQDLQWFSLADLAAVIPVSAPEVLA